MSDDDTCSAEQRAALEPPGTYANQVFLNVIDGMIRISFGLKAGGHIKYTEAVTVSPGLALALRALIETYVKPPADAERTEERRETKERIELDPAKEIRSFRSTPH
ncbi:hypothetical protein LJR225_003081 [Phenylobacterium sp. LjRoot225]|uniref:hypothetical protein n=1 Tax=Phenylobacterium sp. LjRoot225 TaxID=3342285 RepID=UPI003ED059E6